MYVWFPLSLRNVEDLLHERGIEISHETVRFWWHRFGLLGENSRLELGRFCTERGSNQVLGIMKSIA